MFIVMVHCYADCHESIQLQENFGFYSVAGFNKEIYTYTKISSCQPGSFHGKLPRTK